MEFSYYGDNANFTGNAKQIMAAIENDPNLPISWDFCTLTRHDIVIARGEIAVFATLQKYNEDEDEDELTRLSMYRIPEGGLENDDRKKAGQNS